MATELKPVLRYFGSKTKLAPWIVGQFPRHEAYLEPFFGGGSILLVKPRVGVETVNDLDDRVCNLFRVIRDHPRELAEQLRWTPYSRREYFDSRETTGDAIEDARRFVVQCRQGCSARTDGKNGWLVDLRGTTGTSPAQTWENLPERVIALAERLQGVQVDNRPALEVIRRARSSLVLIYADPPYVPETRNEDVYRYEMSLEDHVELLTALDEHPGPVVLSGYDNDLYRERLAHWVRRTSEAKSWASSERVEVLWLNQSAARGQGQGSFDLT